VRGDEQLRQVVVTTSQDYLLCVCASGRVYQIATHRIPAGTRSAKGEPVRKLLELAAGEEVAVILPVEAYDEDRYLVIFSKQGKVKKSPLSEYRTIDVDGAQDMKLADADCVVTALISRGRGEYFITSDNAQTLRFSDEQLRAQGRVGQGVAAMALGKGAAVVSADYLDSEEGEHQTTENLVSLFVVTEQGIGKKVPVSQYPQKGRATAGVVTTELLNNDRVQTAMLNNENNHFLISWSAVTAEKGEQLLALKATDIKAFPRARKGVELVAGRINGIVRL